MFKNAQIRFTWTASAKCPAPWRLGLFAIHRRPAGDISSLAYLSVRARQSFRKSTVFLSVGGLLAWGCGLACAGFFFGAFVLLQIQQRHPHNQITYADLVLPWRWSSLDALRGQAIIGQAKDKFTDGKIMEGFQLLRLGLARHPGHVQTRLDLARLYILLRLRGQSDKVLMDAFAHGYPGLRFLVVASALLAEGDNSRLVEEFIGKARDSLAAAGGAAEDERVLDEIEINARLQAGRASDAAALAARLYPDGDYKRLIVEIEAALQAGEPDAAGRLTEAWVRLRPGSEETLLAAAAYYRQAGRHDDMQALIDRLRAQAPSDPRFATFGIVENIRAGRHARASVALDDWFFRYGANERAYAELVRSITATGRDDYLDRIEATMRDHGFDLLVVQMGRLVAQIEARDWTRAVVTGGRLRGLARRQPPSNEAVIALASACADAGGGTQKIFIDAFLRSPGNFKLNRMFIEALDAAGRYATARELITLIEGWYPQSDYIRDATVRIETRLAAQALEQKAARPEAADAPGPFFADARSFLGELDRLGALPDGGSVALSLIRGVRKTAPSWLAAADEELSRRELELTVQAGDLPMLQLAVRGYLRGREARSQPALDMAARWHEAGRKSEPILVAREILRASPDFQPALKALTAWEPRPLQAIDRPAAPGP